MSIKILDSMKKFITLKNKRNIKINNLSDSEIFLPFDEVIRQGNMGSGEKQFVRIKGKFLSDLYYLQKNNNSSVVSCVDMLIKSDDFSLSDFEEFGVSAIVKNIRNEHERKAYIDILCSELAPLFNVRTSYVTTMPNDNNRLIYVDFLSEGEKIETFTEMAGTQLTAWKNDIEEWMEHMSMFIARRSTCRGKNSIKENKQIIKDFIKLFLFKKYIICDSDLSSTNFAITYTNNYDNTNVAPAYDFEYGFNNRFTLLVGKMAEMENDISYLTKIYPEEMTEIISEFHIDKAKKKDVCDIIDRHEKRPSKNTKLKSIVIDNVDMIEHIYNREITRNNINSDQMTTN